jgi:type II secretory pathway pseudopilin PulG
MKQKNQKRNRGGFTLAETLIAVLILTMVAGIVAGGIPAARNALDKAVDTSHSQLLLSTTMTSLRNELAMARSITCASEPDDDDESVAEDPAARKIISYVDSSGAVCTLQSEDDGIYVAKEASPDISSDVYHPRIPQRLLVSEQAATKNLYAAFTSASYNNGIVKIEGLKVCKKQGDSELVLSDLGDVAFEIEVIGRKG